MSGGLLAELFLIGLTTGAYYALLGVSWSIIFSTTRVFHFAHGLVFIVAAYMAVHLVMNLNFPFWAGYLLAVLTAIVLGCLIEWAFYRPLRRLGASIFVIFVTSLGLLILGQNVIQMIFSAAVRTLEGFPASLLTMGEIRFSNIYIFMSAVSIVGITGIWLYLKSSKMGKAIRAVAANPSMAEIVGIDKDKVFLLAFALGSGALGLAAIPFVAEHGVVPSAGMAPLFAAFIVTFIGGAGRIGGAVVGGLILGLAENFAMLWFTHEWKIVVGFVVLVILVIARPKGLFEHERASKRGVGAVR